MHTEASVKLSGALPADYQVGNPMLPWLVLSFSKRGSQLDSGTILPPCKRRGALYGTCSVEGSSHHESTSPQGSMCLGGFSHPQEAQPTGYSSLRRNAFHWAGFLHLVQSPTRNEETQNTMATFSFLSPWTPLWRHYFDLSLENIFRFLILYRNVPAHLYDRMHY